MSFLSFGRPFLHFFVLGALLFGARQLWPAREPIVIGSADAVDEAVLVEEALRLGLDRTDPVVRARLALNLRFTRGESEDGEILEADIEQALALGMARRDVVVRRRLALLMADALAQSATPDAPEIDRFIAAHPQRYAPAARVSLQHIFIADSAAAASLLPSGVLEQRSAADLARVFGTGLAQAVMQAPVGQWAGPFRSAYGLHVVQVTSRDAAAADHAVARRQAYYALLEQREQAVLRDAVADLRGRYRIEVAAAP